MDKYRQKCYKKNKNTMKQGAINIMWNENVPSRNSSYQNTGNDKEEIFIHHPLRLRK